jgi:predicted nucleotidyltransferase
MISESAIQEAVDEIVRGFGPERVILFGSYAWGAPTPNSDVDLLVILPFAGKPLRQSVAILERIDGRFPVDVLARRPDDTARRYAEGDPLIREALDRGRVMYECHRSGVD